MIRKKRAYLKTIVSPAAKFHLALLVVEWKPGDVDLARALEDARRDVETASVVSHHDVCGVRSVETLVRTANTDAV